MSNNSVHSRTNEAYKIGNIALAAAENLGKELKASANLVGSAIKDAGYAVSSNVGNAAEEAYDTLVESGREGAKELESKVKKSPLLAVGVAFGIGMIASALCFRRHD